MRTSHSLVLTSCVLLAVLFASAVAEPAATATGAGIQTTRCNETAGLCFFSECDPSVDTGCYEDADACYSDDSTSCYEAQVDHPVHLTSNILGILLTTVVLLIAFAIGFNCVWSLQTPEYFETGESVFKKTQ